MQHPAVAARPPAGKPSVWAVQISLETAYIEHDQPKLFFFESLGEPGCSSSYLHPQTWTYADFLDIDQGTAAVWKQVSFRFTVVSYRSGNKF